jgi:hypothetical protein
VTIRLVAGRANAATRNLVSAALIFAGVHPAGFAKRDGIARDRTPVVSIVDRDRVGRLSPDVRPAR